MDQISKIDSIGTSIESLSNHRLFISNYSA